MESVNINFNYFDGQNRYKRRFSLSIVLKSENSLFSNEQWTKK